MLSDDLLHAAGLWHREHCELAPGVHLLRGHALDELEPLLAALRAVIAAAPLRFMRTPGGRRMAVSMTNCGRYGWVSDARGYRYSPCDPLSGSPWPALPAVLEALAVRAAACAGFADFAPDACLLNRYRPGAGMGLHQDRDERDFTQPIVSISLGLPATFLLGGLQRSQRPRPLRLEHGDVLVWGGPARLFHHGVSPLREGCHPRLGAQRLNLTLRCSGLDALGLR